MTESARQELARQQSQLVRSLHNATAFPEGFDAEQLRAAGQALLQKRLRTVAKVCPAIAECLGADFSREFALYAKNHPLPRGGAVEDAMAFSRELIHLGKLPMKLRWQLFLWRCRMSRHRIFPFLAILAAVSLTGCASQSDSTFLHPDLALVKISALSSDPGQSTEGRGFFVTGDGLIVTCLHNLERGASIIVTPAGGPPSPAEVVQQDVQDDLAIIRVSGAHHPFLHFYESDILPGIHVRVVGSEGTNHGVFDHWENLGREMAFTARIGVGDAGAPLIADNGRVVGVARGIIPERPNVNVAMPIWHVLQMMPSLLSMQSVVPSQ